jgi:hypothetical protein
MEHTFDPPLTRATALAEDSHRCATSPRQFNKLLE